MPEERHRITSFNRIGLIVAAISFDTLQLLLFWLPLGGVLIGVFARLVFWVWFTLLKVGFSDTSKRLMVNITISLAEIVPLVDMLPSWTIGTIAIIHQVKIEDKKYNKDILEKYNNTQSVTTHFPNGSPRRTT